MIGSVFKQLVAILEDGIDINFLPVLKNISWLFMADVLRVLSGFFVGVLIVRHLGATDYGLYSLTLSITSIFAVLASLGLKDPVILELGHNQESGSELISSVAVLLFISGVLSYSLLLIFIYLVFPFEKELLVLCSIFGTTVLFKFPEVAEIWFESELKSKYISIIKTLSLFTFAIIKFALVIAEASLLYFILIASFEILVSFALLFIVFLLKGPHFKIPKHIITPTKRLLKFSWPLLLSSLSVILYIRIDQLMLAKIINTEEVGLYTSGTKIVEATFFLPSIIAASFYPYLINQYEKNLDLFYAKVESLFSLSFVLSFGLAFALCLFSNSIVQLLYGDDFASASSVLSVYSWMIVLTFWGVISGKLFMIYQRPMLNLERTLIGLGLNVIFNLILIPKFGGVGAAYASLIANFAAAYLFDCFRKGTRHMFFIKTRSINVFKLFRV